MPPCFWRRVEGPSGGRGAVADAALCRSMQPSAELRAQLAGLLTPRDEVHDRGPRRDRLSATGAKPGKAAVEPPSMNSKLNALLIVTAEMSWVKAISATAVEEPLNRCPPVPGRK